MEELLNWMEYIEDSRQAGKVRHKLKDILVIVLFATLANADDWVEIALFGKEYQDFLRKYIDLENGAPSHDTISRGHNKPRDGNALTGGTPAAVQQMAGAVEPQRRGSAEKDYLH